MMEDDPQRDPVEELAAEFLEQYRQGARPTVEQYARQYPQLAEQIRDLFPAVAALENLKLRKEERIDGRASMGPVKLERLGDLRIIGEIGRGGMGIVYEAEQRSLGRHVAVKVLPRQSLLDGKRLARFKREARTAAKLHHTNIVPILGIGESDGHHYYVMQYIRGVGLDEIVTQLANSSGSSTALGFETAHSSSSLRSDEVTGVVKALLAGRFRHPSQAGSSTASLMIHPRTDLPGRPSRPGRVGGDTTELGRRPLSDSDQSPGDAPKSDPERDASAAQNTKRAADPAQLAGNNGSGGAIRGAPSATALLGRQYFHSVARIGVQVADALRYAHAQGTLHRDIKPANLLLDARGVVWVADFGLAKAMEQDNVSRTGDIVGTLRYMAPEQLRGQADARSDIYSLGITLYELLALRPAFSDAECKMSLVGRGKLVDPPHPRRLNGKIPLDLDTIVMKSIAPEAERRYQTAAELAEDLQRFLEDRPILARRVTSVERLWRWCRRNRAVAILSGVAIVMLLLLAAMASVDYLQTKESNVQIQKALDGERRHRQRAEATLEISLEVLEKIAQRYVPSHLSQFSRLTVESEDGQAIEVAFRPPLSQEHAALLEDLLPVYDRFVKGYGESTKLRAAAAKANGRVGDIYKLLGKHEKAESAYETAIQKYQILESASPGENLYEIARLFNELGNVRQTVYDFDGASAAYESARRLLEKPPAPLLQDPYRRFELARTYYFLARRPPHVPAGARPPRNPSASPWQQGLSATASKDDDPPRQAEREQYLAQATALLNKLIEDFPETPDYPHLLALCYREGASGPFSDRLAQAIATLEKLTRQFPEEPGFLYDLIDTYAMINVRDPAVTRENLELAEIRLRTGLDYAEYLSEEQPDVPDYEFAKVRLLHNLGAVLKRSDRTDEALQCYDEALVIQASLVFRFPDVAAYKAWKSMIHFSKARLFLDRQDLVQARPLLEASTQALLDLVGSETDLEFGQQPLVESYLLLEETLKHLGDQPALDALHASEEYRKAMEAFHREQGRNDEFDDQLIDPMPPAGSSIPF